MGCVCIVILQMCHYFQVFPDAFNQQTGHRVHRSGIIRVGTLPTAMLGLLPRWRLLPQTIRGRREQLRHNKSRLVTSCLIHFVAPMPFDERIL